MRDRDSIREELLIHFGRESLPEELRRQVEADPELRAEWRELQLLSHRVPDERSFVLSESELDQLSAAVARRIDEQSQPVPAPVTSVTPVWRRVVAVAATVALVIFGTLTFQRYLVVDNGDEANLVDPYEYYVLQTEAVDEYDISEPMYEAIIYEYTSDVTTESAATLLDDLTDEELSYLTENFDVSELLL